jgi:hypothetical protein
MEIQRYFRAQAIIIPHPVLKIETQESPKDSMPQGRFATGCMGRNQKIPSLHDLQQTPLLDQKCSDPGMQIPATHDLLSRHLESALQCFG